MLPLPADYRRLFRCRFISPITFDFATMFIAVYISLSPCWYFIWDAMLRHTYFDAAVVTYMLRDAFRVVTLRAPRCAMRQYSVSFMFSSMPAADTPRCWCHATRCWFSYVIFMPWGWFSLYYFRHYAWCFRFRCFHFFHDARYLRHWFLFSSDALFLWCFFFITLSLDYFRHFSPVSFDAAADAWLLFLSSSIFISLPDLIDALICLRYWCHFAWYFSPLFSFFADAFLLADAFIATCWCRYFLRFSLSSRHDIFFRHGAAAPCR